MTGPPPQFAPAALTVKAGNEVFFLSNVSHGTHSFAIGPADRSSHCAVSDPLRAGETAVFSVQGLKPGTYAFWCTIDGHAQEGMVGTLSVLP